MIKKFGEWDKLNENSGNSLPWELDPEKLRPLDPNTPDPILFDKSVRELKYPAGGDLLLYPGERIFDKTFGEGRENWDLYNDWDETGRAWRIFAEVKNKRIKTAIKKFNEISRLTPDDLIIEGGETTAPFGNMNTSSTITCKLPGLRKFNIWKDPGGNISVLSEEDYLKFFNSPDIKQKIFMRAVEELLVVNGTYSYLKEF